MLNEAIVKNEEKAVFALRGLYKQYGYLPFKMSKFEEYDLYVQNKDFLVSDSVITFTDRSGKLLALKPDVTLSIIKNTRDEKGVKQKVYYDENVYRVSGSTHEYKEIMQAGLECIGDIDAYDVFEVIYLAAKSLATISSDFVLDLSHMGIFAALLDETSDSDSFKREVDRLLDFLGKERSAKVIVTTGFWKHPGDETLREYAREKGFPTVELGDLGELDEMKAIGLFEHRGVANHPGDKGMEAIADRIFEEIKKLL